MPSASPLEQPAETPSKFKLRPVNFDGALSSGSSDEDFNEPGAVTAEPAHQRSRSPPQSLAEQTDSNDTPMYKPGGRPRSASAETRDNQSGLLHDWSLEPVPVTKAYEHAGSPPLPRPNGKHETVAPPGSVAAVLETSGPSKSPATAQASMPAVSAARTTTTAAPKNNLPPEIANLDPEQIQQLLTSLQPEQLSKMLQLIAPSILAPLGIMSSTTSLPASPAPGRPSSMARANTHPSNVSVRPVPKTAPPSFNARTSGRGQNAVGEKQHDPSAGGQASDSDGDADRDLSVSATNDPADHSRSTDSDRRPRGRQAAPPDPSAGYKPREGHAYQPRDARRSTSGAELVWNYSGGGGRAQASNADPTRQTPSRQPPSPGGPPSQSHGRSSSSHEDTSVAALRIAMETITREAARAATMEARYQQACAEVEKLKDKNGAMQSHFDLQMEKVLRDQQALRDNMYQQQADRIRFLEERLKQAQADHQAARNALRHAEMQAAQRQGDQRREPSYVNTPTAPRYPGPPPNPPPIDTGSGLNLGQSQPPPPSHVRPKEESHHQSPASGYAQARTAAAAAAEAHSTISPRTHEAGAQRQRVSKYPPAPPANQSPAAAPAPPPPHPVVPSSAPPQAPTAYAPDGPRGMKRAPPPPPPPPPPPAPASLSGSPRPQSQRHAQEGGPAAAAEPDDERARKRKRTEHVTDSDNNKELMHFKIGALYEPDQAGNHVCKVCTAHQAPGGGRVGFPRETAPELLAAHAQAEHHGAWELAGRPAKGS